MPVHALFSPLGFHAEPALPWLDAVSTMARGMLRTAGADPGTVRGWGELCGWR